MRADPLPLLVVAAASVLLFPSPARAGATVFPLQVIEGVDRPRGTCFVIHQESLGDETAIYFITSASLFDMRRHPRARIFVKGMEPLDIGPDGIFVSDDNRIDIAVLRAVSGGAWLKPMPIALEPVSPGAGFVISGFHPDGSRALVTQHVRFVEPRTVLGHPSAGGMAGCHGAPAIIEHRVFGLISECAPDRGPVITLLSAARDFLIRTVPGLLDDEVW